MSTYTHRYVHLSTQHTVDGTHKNSSTLHEYAQINTHIHTHTHRVAFSHIYSIMYVHAYQSIAFNLPKIILNFRIRKEYEVITDKALTTPTNTQHLMELKEFMVKAENESLVDLEQRMAIAKHR